MHIISLKIFPYSEHKLPLSEINAHVLQVLTTLNEAGFAAYLVGGGPRDLLMSLHPKDFDVATDAKPEQIRKLFHNCRLIGRRFRLAHIYFRRNIVEVATFRGAIQYCDVETGMIVDDNIYGSMEEDVLRRDFTVNALLYNHVDATIIDYMNGMQDLQHKVIRAIGDPERRYHEDPVRMLRAFRLAAKLNFSIDAATKEPIIKLAGLLQNVAASRLFDEICKWFSCGASWACFKLLHENGILAVLFPQTAADLLRDENRKIYALLRQGFKNTDKRVMEHKSLNPAFLFAVLLWWPVQKRLFYYQNMGMKLFVALNFAIQDVIRQQTQHITLTRRITKTIKEVWVLQYRFARRKKTRTRSILRNPSFKIAYDFLLLRAQAGEKLSELVDWWTKKIVA